MDLPHPLHPRVVEQHPFAGFSWARSRHEGDVAMDRIVAEALTLEVFHSRYFAPAVGGSIAPSFSSWCDGCGEARKLGEGKNSAGWERTCKAPSPAHSAESFHA